MNQGVIEQAAPAREVYSRPRSRYVARFMSAQNLLRGRVGDVAGGSLVLEGPAGERFRLPRGNAAAAPGAELHFAVRRDLVSLVRGAAPAAENAVRGTVDAVEYQGTYVKVTVAGAADDEFIVNEPEAVFFASPLKRGDPVVASWAAETVHLLEPDRAGGDAARPYAQAGV
jgi:putative spermidine/putrescine transport system ATP-binding protein